MSDSSPEARMQSLLDEALDFQHGDDCQECAMARVLQLLADHPKPEFLGAVQMAIGRLQAFGSVRLPREERRGTV